MKLTEPNIFEKRIFSSKEVENFLKTKNYADALVVLLRNQKLDWKFLSKGYAALEKVRTKTFQFDGYTINAQLNSQRIKSTTANVKKEDVEKRECFLCLDNLPKEQLGLEYKNEFLLLCNPYPVFYEHFTIVFKKHFPQRIDDSFHRFLKLAKRVSRYYSILYNGAQCGASAPDHLHFQAVAKKDLIIIKESESLINKYGEKLVDSRRKDVYGISDGLRKFILIKSKDINFIKNLFNNIYTAFKNAVKKENEPLINIIGNYNEKFGWEIYIFLRRKHRPDCYFEKGDKTLTISPAAIDLSGTLILPRKEDFNKIDKEKIKNIFEDVIIGKELFDYLKSHLKKILE